MLQLILAASLLTPAAQDQELEKKVLMVFVDGFIPGAIAATETPALRSPAGSIRATSRPCRTAQHEQRSGTRRPAPGSVATV